MHASAEFHAGGELILALIFSSLSPPPTRAFQIEREKPLSSARTSSAQL
jgi:hypothetical protein